MTTDTSRAPAFNPAGPIRDTVREAVIDLIATGRCVLRVTGEHCEVLAETVDNGVIAKHVYTTRRLSELP